MEPASLRPPTSSKVRRTRTSVVGARQTDVFDLGDLADWTEDGVRRLAYAIAADEADRQTAKGNPPTEARVDGSLSKGVDQMRRNIEVLFGADNARPSMDALERLAKEEGPISVQWVWLVRDGPNAPRIRREIASGGPVMVTLSDVLYLVPRGASEADMALLNIARMEGRAFHKKGELRLTGSGPQRSGFMGVIARKARARIRPMRFHVTARVSREVAGRLNRSLGPQNRPRRPGFRVSEPAQTRKQKKAGIKPPGWGERGVFHQGVWFLSLRKSLR